MSQAKTRESGSAAALLIRIASETVRAANEITIGGAGIMF
jgi:hypothetical protein